MTGVGELIEFPTKSESDKLRAELKAQEEEIQLCLDDLQALNEHIIELTAEYENLLNRLCNIHGIDLTYGGDND